MKVVVKRGSVSATGWLPMDMELSVLAVMSDSASGTKYLLWSEQQNSPALFPANEFEIVDGSLPEAWRLSLDLNGYAYLAPFGWHASGFWERYYDGEPEAVRVFNEGAGSR